MPTAVYSYKNLLLIVGRKVAIDASMCIYQFLIAVRSDGQQLTNDDGQITRYKNFTCYTSEVA